jgi:short-subunit dehydrogenase
MVVYAASKAFDMVLAEVLWAEVHDRGVDVLGLILGLTDTPALLAHLGDGRRPSSATCSGMATSSSGPCLATTPCAL